MLQCNLLHVKQRHQFSTGVGRGGALPLVLGDAEPPWGLSEAETPPAGVGGRARQKSLPRGSGARANATNTFRK